MAELYPFRAIRPTPATAAKIASVPYDVCSRAEAKALADGNPLSFLRVTRAEIELDDAVDSHAGEVYARGRANLEALQAQGALVREDRPALYLYRQIMGDHAQTGIVGTFSVDAYDAGRVVKHEHTRPTKEKDRTDHAEALGAQCGPVFLTFRSTPGVDAVIATETAADPFVDLTAVDGVQHTVWRLDGAAQTALLDAFAGVEPLYIADGHHRSAAASNLRRRRRERGALGEGDPSERFLAVAFPTHAVQILPYNRLLHEWPDGCTDAASLLAKIREQAPVEDAGDGTPASSAEARLFTGGRWYRIALEAVADTPVGRLAPQIVQDRILAAVWGIVDPRTDDRISFVGGIRGTGELEARTDGVDAVAAISLPAVTPDELLAVADAGKTMPPKCTWFEPKLRSGLFTYALEGRA